MNRRHRKQLRSIPFLLALLIGWVVIIQSQQSKPIVTLSPDASKQWMEAQRQINELQLRIDNLRLQQQVLALGEGVPKGYQVAGADAQGRVFYVAPETAKAVASPEKKP